VEFEQIIIIPRYAIQHKVLSNDYRSGTKAS